MEKATIPHICSGVQCREPKIATQRHDDNTLFHSNPTICSVRTLGMCGTLVVFPGTVAECLTERRGPAAAQKAVPTAAPRTSRNAKQAMPKRSLSSSPAAIRHVEHSRPEHSRPAQVRDVSSCFQKSMSEALNTPPLHYWPRSNRLSRTLVVVVLRPL